MLLAPGLQALPDPSKDSPSPTVSFGNQSSEASARRQQFLRAQSITSAVDYEYFDVGIGQVTHTHKDTYPLPGVACKWYFVVTNSVVT